MLKLTDYTLIPEHCVDYVKEPGNQTERLSKKESR